MSDWNLFGEAKPIAQPEPAVTTEVTVVQSGLSTIDQPTRKPSVSRTIALPIYEAAIVHLSTHDIPHFTPFRIKESKQRLKWCIDQTENHTDMLTLYWEVERTGQNLDKPSATYHQWELLYSRSMKPQTTPKAIGLKPRKARSARGSRKVSTTVRDAS